MTSSAPPSTATAADGDEPERDEDGGSPCEQQHGERLGAQDEPGRDAHGGVHSAGPSGIRLVCLGGYHDVAP